MTPDHISAQPVTDFPSAAESALLDAARRCGLNPAGARLIRLFGTAVYYLPAASAVARIAPLTSPSTVTRLATSIQVTRWLAQIGFPAVEPLSVYQPVIAHGCAITFWHYLTPRGPEPGVADLGRLLRQLHHLDPPPIQLPAYQPLISVRQAIRTSHAITEDDRLWLTGHAEHLLDAYAKLAFKLPAGLIHADAWRGNLLRAIHRVVLIDWDYVSTGPREIDLIPTLQATRFGLSEADCDAFITAYGHDLRNWNGYTLLRDMRELSTLSAILRDAHTSTTAKEELRIRLRSLRTSDSEQWTPF